MVCDFFFILFFSTSLLNIKSVWLYYIYFIDLALFINRIYLFNDNIIYNVDVCAICFEFMGGEGNYDIIIYRAQLMTSKDKC